jgi:light-regulated signal transduction histidine kinase (bacteriophytochrome)
MGMGRLIDGLLAVSRLGRAGLSFADVDMTELARGVLDELRALEPSRKIKVDLEPLGPAHCDPTMVRQVWANLISNALKFTRKQPLAQIDIGCRKEAGETVYFVRDDGVGFDMKYSDKLFGIFQRLHASSEFDGAGIGLAIVHRIVERHAGRVWAESAVGHGATFYFALPGGINGGV